MGVFFLSILISFYMDACLLPMTQPYSRPLFYSSFTFAPSSMVSFYFQDYTNGFMMFLLFLTNGPFSTFYTVYLMNVSREFKGYE